jgi:superfamily I DNA/RNA helicase
MIDKYRPVLTGIDALDADYVIAETRIQNKQITSRDLLPLALIIVHKSKAARMALRQTYSHVFLDEFQDCTKDQYELVHATFYGSTSLLTAVGDTKQRIMGWAGALEGTFKLLAKDFNALPLNLYQNFRSQPLLRRMQNSMIQVMDPAAAVPAEDLAGEGGTIDVVRFNNDGEEAEFVSRTIRELVNSGTPKSEIAVLVSKQTQLYAAPLMARLREIRIAYRNEQVSQDFAAEPVVELIQDFLRVVFSDHQSTAYTRLVGVTAGMATGDEAEYKARARVQRHVRDCREKVAGSGLDHGDLDRVRELVFGLLRIIGREAVAALSFDYQRGNRLDELIAEVLESYGDQLSVDCDPVGALARMSEDTVVRILTIHKSKGLEFDTVIILGIESEAFFGKIDDERSAFFVGISRAKTRLILTTVGQRPWPNGYSGIWSVKRSPYTEFLSYALRTQ